MIQVKSASKMCGDSLFLDDIKLYCPTLKGGRIWKREHDLMLLRALLKYVLVLATCTIYEFLAGFYNVVGVLFF